MDGKEQNWLILRKRDEQSDAERHRPQVPRDARDARARRAARRAVDVRGEVGRLPRARVPARLGGAAPLAARQRPDAAIRERREGDPEGGEDAARRARRRGLRARRARPCELLRDADGRHARSSTTSSTCSRSRACRSSTSRCASAGAGSRSCSTARNRTVRLSEEFDDGDALFEAAKEQKLEGIMAKRLDSRYYEGRRTRDWLKIKTRGRQEFVIAGYTHGGGRRASTFGSLILGGARRATSCSTSATSAPASTTPRSAGCSRCSSRFVARRVRSGQFPSFRACARMRSCGSSRSSSPKSSSRSGRTTAICARPSYQSRCARTRTRRTSSPRRRRRSRRTSARASASS